MAVRKIRNAWVVDIRANYCRRRWRSPENTKSGAEAYEATLRHKLACGESIEKVSEELHRKQTLEEFVPQWFKEYVVPNNKHSEQRTKKYILEASLVPFFGKLHIEQITSHHIERYKAQMSGSGLTNKTINNHLTVLRKCLITAYDWFELDGAVPKITWLKNRPPKTEYLSPEECELLLSKAEGVVREMLLTAMRTGMRQGELRGLQWSSVDWQNQTITVRHSRCDYTKELTSPKSNRERHIPMDSEVYASLFKRKKTTGYVFVDYDGKPFDNQRLSLRLKHVRKNAGIRKFGWHALRHTFASHLALRGVPLTAVKELMGHSNITTTMRYAHLAPSTLRAAIDLLNPKNAFLANFGQQVGTEWLQAQQSEIAQKGSKPENA